MEEEQLFRHAPHLQASTTRSCHLPHPLSPPHRRHARFMFILGEWDGYDSRPHHASDKGLDFAVLASNGARKNTRRLAHGEARLPKTLYCDGLGTREGLRQPCTQRKHDLLSLRGISNVTVGRSSLSILVQQRGVRSPIDRTEVWRTYTSVYFRWYLPEANYSVQATFLFRPSYPCAIELDRTRYIAYDHLRGTL